MIIRSVINIRYKQIREMDISNGEGIGIALFVQGCHFHCHNCFNSETWDFNGGKEWIQEVENKFIELANRPYIKRISILGGEPLANQNVEEVTRLVKKCKKIFQNKEIWLWSGFDFETYISKLEIIKYLDYVIDGKYIEELKNASLLFRGSSNQRVINVQESLKQNKVILYCD